MPSAPPPIELCLFDIAGTLMDDAGVTAEAFRRTLEEAGHAFDPALVKPRMGRRKPAVLGELLAIAGWGEDAAARRAEAERLALRFDDAMLDVLDEVRPRPLPGALDAVRELAAANVAIGWTTGYARRVAERALGIIGLGDLGPGAASDEVERGRPAPDLVRLAMSRHGVADPARVATVGDTPNDLLAGVAAGCGRVVGVGHGTHALNELEACPHSHLVPTLEGFVDRVIAPRRDRSG